MRARDVAVVLSSAIGATVAMFAPALFGDRVLALGDGLIEAVPAFYAPSHLWAPDLFLGYPLYADSSQAAFYTLRALRFVPGGFNLYIILSYVITLSALFGYLMEVLRDRLASAAGAVSFTFGGFMMSHIGHPMIDHPAAWSVVALWTLARFIRTRGSGWLAGTAASEALALSSGQPQVVLFAIVLLVTYSLAAELPRAIRQRTFGGVMACWSAIALGVGLGTAFYLPPAQFGAHSTRAVLPYPAFAQDNVPIAHVAQRLSFPYAAGGSSAGFAADAPLMSAGGASTETTIFVCGATIVLAVAGLMSRPRVIVWYWGAAALIGLALAVGNELPFALWSYAIPPFNAFRIPGRHAYEITLSLSILAACGISGLSRQPRPFAVIAGVVTAVILNVLGLRDVASADPGLTARAPVTWFAIAAIAQGAAIVAACFLKPIARGALMAAAVICGSAMYASLGYWRDAPEAGVLRPPAFVAALRALPIDPGQRMYSYADDALDPLRPNLPVIWGEHEAAGYVPLQYPRIKQFLNAGENGRLLDIDSEATDLASIRYVAVPAQRAMAGTEASPFDLSDLDVFLSAPSPDAPRSITFGPPSAEIADRVAIVSALGESVDVRQGAIVASVRIGFADGASETMPIRAGVDTSELGYNRPDIIARVRHSQAIVFSRDEASTWFAANKAFSRRRAVRSVEIELASGTRAFNVRKVSLIDSIRRRAFAFSGESEFFSASGRFRHVEDVGGVAIFENMRARPRSWLEPANGGSLALTILTPERRAMTVSCPAVCHVISSDENNSDWRPRVDGHDVPIGETHGVLESVAVGPGRHLVAFTYAPRALLVGLVISGVAAVGLSLWIAWPTWSRRQRPKRGAS